MAEKGVFYRCLLPLLLIVLLFPPSALAADSETIIDPVLPVPDYVSWLLEVASSEVGYREEEHGRTKYGEWAGDPYSQWCAEFLCWCVNQVDQIHGTSLSNQIYPIWSASNTGRAWFIQEGRFAIRSGEVNGWGYEWMKGQREFLRPGSYIPQPGDYVFFTWTSGTDTDHVALVEYCAKDAKGNIRVHVIEGNNPVAVTRNVYALTSSQILGFGTVHDLVDITMRFGNEGQKVRQLQQKLVRLGYLEEAYITGHFGNATADALRRFQTDAGLRPNALANIDTQLLLDEKIKERDYNDPTLWMVVEDEDSEDGF